MAGEASAGQFIETPVLPFEQLAPGFGVGQPAPAGWRSLATAPLLILVGVTGVGKSTLLENLAQRGPAFYRLPDRRELTDRLIIATMQAADGRPVAPVTDRKARFEYTRRYRERFAGGMAHALAQLLVDPAATGSYLLFDGLRGANEVAHAATCLPLARFAMLDAPDWVRVQRLLNRRDNFDHIAGPTNAHDHSAEVAADLTALGVEEAATLFTPAEAQSLLDWAGRGEVDRDDLRAKLQIVLEERRSYDPAATLAALQTHAPDRTLYLDTVALSPQAVAETLLKWIAQYAD
jgi:hypothetical protein